ncbi:MAG: prtrc system protein e [Pseudopedobacter saltans]|uniref:Prtrc system protein e n=1 Tax=Pseudopedobacter saltans TaxID=151895 RepID=A0A2W5EG52_9SPHI|nr:MAG: prtrc system protein e [Pseudopedobacter saltans]
MNTNFFNQIQQLDFTGVLQLNISKGAENNLVVSVLLNNDGCGDSAKNLIAPLTFNATPQAFDEGFFEQIKAPIQTVSGVMVDMEKFLKQMEEVKKQSAMDKTHTDKAKPLQMDKDKKYWDALRKSEELEKQGKYRAAWSALPEPSALQEKQATEVRKRRSLLAAKFEPDLFAAPMETVKSTDNQATKEEDLLQDSIDTMYGESDDLDDYEDEIENEDLF